MNTDLKEMTIKELEKLRSDVDKALANARAKAVRAARKAAKALAAEFGVSLEEITTSEQPAKPRKQRKSAPARKSGKPKYANPADKSQTWTGKGRQPNWFKEAIAAGKSPEDMAI